MPEDVASVATNTSNSSASDAVEKEGDVMLDAEFDRLLETVTSVAIADHAGAVAKSSTVRPSIHPIVKRPELLRLIGGVGIETSLASAAAPIWRTVRPARVITRAPRRRL
jgi:hypothetical protein